MKLYEIRNHIKKEDYPVKKLGETKHLVLHRPANMPLDSKIRTYVITLKRRPTDGIESDYALIMITDLKIGNCLFIMKELESNFDFSSDFSELSRNEDLRERLKSIRSA